MKRFIGRTLLLMLMLHPEGAAAAGDPQPDPNQKPKEKKPEEMSTVELAKALKELRENSVSKEDYEKVVQTNKELVAQVINGGEGGNGQPAPEKVDISALREELYGPKGADLSNLDFWKKTLKLRNAVLEQEGYDPFLPHGAKIKPSETDVERANAVANVVQECIDEAEDNSEVFTALLQSKTNNDSPSFTAHLKKIGALK